MKLDLRQSTTAPSCSSDAGEVTKPDQAMESKTFFIITQDQRLTDDDGESSDHENEDQANGAHAKGLNGSISGVHTSSHKLRYWTTAKADGMMSPLGQTIEFDVAGPQEVSSHRFTVSEERNRMQKFSTVIIHELSRTDGEGRPRTRGGRKRSFFLTVGEQQRLRCVRVRALTFFFDATLGFAENLSRLSCLSRQDALFLRTPHRNSETGGVEIGRTGRSASRSPERGAVLSDERVPEGKMGKVAGGPPAGESPGDG
nr:hypothetical protein Iba_chr10eCG2260 [Ipomoea batatas]